MAVFESHGEAETEGFAFELAKKCRPGNVYCLSGDLGVGKTAFARGFAKGLGVSDDVASPTFTLVHEYDGVAEGKAVRFCHFDIYRLADEDELYDIGWEDYLSESHVLLVEWADILRDSMPPEAIWITITKDLSKGLDYRCISVQ